jgi:PIN domain nuclease of toxin-antitoxin system
LIFLDTHVLVWTVADEGRLSRTAASAIRRARNSDGIAIANVVVWELAFLLARGVLRTHNTIEKTLENFIVRSGVVVRSITTEIAAIAAQFPSDYPRDPVDRIVGATARAEGMALVTKDERIRNSLLVKTIW